MSDDKQSDEAGSMPEQETAPGRGRQRRVRGQVSVWLIAVAVLLCVATGGGTQLWAQGLFLILCGLWALWIPPYRTPTRKVDWVLLLLLGWCFLSFLPQGLMGRASWRKQALSSGLDLGWMATPQPWVTAEALVLLVAGVVAFYLVWNTRVDYASRRRTLWTWAVVVALMAVGSFVLRQYWGVRQEYQVSQWAYSYFPNKNQTGLFMAMGGVVSFALTIYRFYVRLWKSALGALLCLILCMAGVYESGSRASLILLFLGCLLWIPVAIPPRRLIRILRVVIPIMVVVMVCLLLLGKNSMERFRHWFNEGTVRELRVDIYEDTFVMVTKLPPFGTGAGNFEPVFRQFRQQVDVPGSILHPESDWLWVMAEWGVPGFSLLGMALLFLLARQYPLGKEDGPEYRAAALCVLVIFLIHSLIDVPGHRFGTLLTAFLFYRLAARPVKAERLVLFPRWTFRVVGVGLVLVGLVWLMADWMQKPWHSSVATELSLSQLSEAIAEQGVVLDEVILEESTQAQPMDWRPYTQRARYQLLQRRDTEAAQKDFAIAAFLEPNAAEVSYQEGLAWLGFSPRLASRAWREALQRKSPVPQDLYTAILSHGGRTPQFSRELAALSLLDPALRERYLLQKRGRSFDDAIVYERSEDPGFTRFKSEQRAKLLKHWAMHSEGDSLRGHLRRFPEITDYPWYYEGLSWAAVKDYQRAVEVVGEYLPIPRFPEFVHFSRSDGEELRRKLVLNPNDVVGGSVLLKRQLERQDWEGSRDTLSLLKRGEEMPMYLRYWDGELKRMREDWEGAWKAWLPYMETVVDPGSK